MSNSYGEAAGYTVQMEGPFGETGTAGKAGSITLYPGSWKGGESPYTQAVEIDFVSANSIVELQPAAEDLQMLCEKGIALVAENDGGAVTIHAIGGKPDGDLTIQCTTREVVRV